MAKTEADANAAPTQEEIDAAKAVMQRAAEAQQRAAAERLKPVSDVVAMPEFAAVRSAIDALPPELMADMNVAPHIMALKAGFNGFSAVAPAPAPATEAAGGVAGATV